MNKILFLSLVSIACLACQRNIAHNNVVYSQNVKDSFEVFISLPATYDSARSYDVIYYCDANLNSGKLLRELITKEEYAEKVNKSIFVGVGHKGDFHVLRRRDFILPDIQNGDTAGASADFGQVEHFYDFLKYELIPSINSSYNTNDSNNAIIGHSLGGLFAFYCLFKNDSLFHKYYALSPSLWVDNYGIYQFNRLAAGITTPKKLYFSAGSLEFFNRIKPGTDEMQEFLKSKGYNNLSYQYQVHPGENHNSQVKLSMDYILRDN